MMKFDFCIGNPPYQDQTRGENKGFAPPIYDKFLDAAVEIAAKVEMIHPARFLFNAGSTSKAWNEKMLNDPHFKVLSYEEDASKFFCNTDIKGGVAITYRDSSKGFEPIEVFTPQEELNKIFRKVKSSANFSEMTQLVITRTAYRFTPQMHDEHPEAICQLSDGHAFDVASNIFQRLPQIFFNDKPKDENEYIQILGRENNERVYKYVRKDYIKETANTFKYKVVLPKASGVGKFGETISNPFIDGPGFGSTETFITIGAFDSNLEANNALKYICTKFARTLLGILKRTQEITPEKWKYVPIQDFTNSSDINWSTSIPEIDQQLYVKYGLSQEEIAFIETHVKEME